MKDNVYKRTQEELEKALKGSCEWNRRLAKKYRKLQRDYQELSVEKERLKKRLQQWERIC